MELELNLSPNREVKDYMAGAAAPPSSLVYEKLEGRVKGGSNMPRGAPVCAMGECIMLLTREDEGRNEHTES